jgi:hypothetical protein
MAVRNDQVSNFEKNSLAAHLLKVSKEISRGPGFLYTFNCLLFFVYK